MTTLCSTPFQQAIEKIPLFKELNAICKITIIQKLQAKVAVPGEYLAVQDYIGEHMFIIKNGKVHLKRTPTTRQKWGSAIKSVRERVRGEAKWGEAARDGARRGEGGFGVWRN